MGKKDAAALWHTHRQSREVLLQDTHLAWTDGHKLSTRITLHWHFMLIKSFGTFSLKQAHILRRNFPK